MTDWKDPKSRAGYYAAYRLAHLDRIRAQTKAFRQENAERLAARSRRYHEENREHANARQRERDAVRRAQNPGVNAARNREDRLALRQQMLAAYGGKCACCGETEFAFLQLDHVNGGGHKELIAAGGCNTTVYRRLRREGWPEGYQILCANCNYAKAFSPGGCPHRLPLDSG